ncbi:MAG: DUF2953 domain-containing protein [Firmicutes bacterium]|nr:DUF2953 domain-containing protein [Bacillota bacterium]
MLFVFPWFFYLLFLLLFILASILLIPFQLRISFNNLRKDNSASLELEIFIGDSLKLTGFEKTFFLDESMEAIVRAKRGWEPFKKEQLRKTLLLVYRFMQTLRWVTADIKIKIGTGDSAWTAMLVGFLRQLSAMAFARFFWAMPFAKKPLILVYPSFEQRTLLFSCSFKFFVHGTSAIYYTLLVLWEHLRIKLYEGGTMK